MRVILRYEGRQECEGYESLRLWSVISPELPGYTYNGRCFPTFGLETLKELGLVK